MRAQRRRTAVGMGAAWLAAAVVAAAAAPGAARAAGAAEQPGTAELPAREIRPGELRLVTERAVVFKDGHALIVKSAMGRADAKGRVFTEEVPESAVLGSFWAVPAEGTIRAMRAQWVQTVQEREAPGPATTMAELLRANIGREVTLAMSWEGGEEYAGVIEGVLERPPEEHRPEPWPPEPRAVAAGHWNMQPEPERPPLTVVEEVAPRGGQFVVVAVASADGAAGRVVLPVAQVRNLSGKDLVTTAARRERVTRRAKRLSFELGEEAAGQPAMLTVMYFTPGVRWIPTYRVRGELESTAQLELQAEVLNELEDLSGVEVDLVAGVPNFRFKDVVSPLSLEATLRNALVRAAPQVMGAQSQVSNAYFSQRAGEWAGGGGPEGVPEAAAELAAAGAAGEQDLFVYSLGEVASLPKGSRMAAPLWTASAPLKHLYTMDLHVARSARNGASDYAVRDLHAGPGAGGAPHGGTGSPLRLAEHRVWHQLELLNTGAGPWTTGPALVMRGALPLGQELLTYTPPKGCALLPVTVAVDVRGNYQEEELGRTPGALKWSASSYALIRKRATVTLVNYTAERVESRVSLSIGGKVETASDGAEVVINDYRAADWGDQPYEARPSNHSDVSWSVTLEPGQTRTLTAEFFYYMR